MNEPAPTLDPGAAGRCAFRTVLDHDATVPPPRRGASQDESILRRTDAAGRHRRQVAALVLDHHGDRALDAGRDVAATLAALRSTDLHVIVDPALPVDATGRRHGAPSLLVADPDAATGAWRPVDVHNHFLASEGTSTLRGATLEHPWLAAAVERHARLRKGGAWRGDLLRLAHHHRRLESLGVAATGRPFVGVVDRGSTLWWLPLDEPFDGRVAPLIQYDARFAERVALLDAIEARNRAGVGERPGAPWWHRECESCPHAPRCHEELAGRDDVSLVRFTDAADQEFLRVLGVGTRRELASLDLGDVAIGAATPDEPSDTAAPVGVVVGRRLKDAARLVRRARVEAAGTLLRLVDGAGLDAHRRDVEIDFDMESYDNATYLWGATVTLRAEVPGLVPGYRAFAEWGPLTDLGEGALFSRFFAWLAATVTTARAAARTVGCYCFWEHAERAQIRRAMASGADGLPDEAQLDDVLLGGLCDVHLLVTSQIQTAGPAGLKVLATEVGFAWRDQAPSGEASMAWFESARDGVGEVANAAKARLLAYNEDDCRATRALRDWLEGPARRLPDVQEARPGAS